MHLLRKSVLFDRLLTQSPVSHVNQKNKNIALVTNELNYRLINNYTYNCRLYYFGTCNSLGLDVFGVRYNQRKIAIGVDGRKRTCIYSVDGCRIKLFSVT